MTAISSDDLVGGAEGSASSPRIDRKASSDLAHAAPIIQVGFVSLGMLAALGPYLALVSPLLAVIAGTLATLLGFALFGWSIARLLNAGAIAMGFWETRIEAAESSEERILLALERIASSLERTATLAPASPRATDVNDPLVEITRAIREAKWDQASVLIREFTNTYPDAPEGDRLTREFESARAEEARGLHAKMAAAREVSDPDRVLELRDALRPLLNEEALRTLDQELTRWLMALIQKRLRAGTIRIDVVELAAKVAERFDHTTEGASLRAALPTLRRSAGLCARCGKPYTGIADACPACLATPVSPVFATEFERDPAEDDEPEQVPIPDDPL